MTDTIKECMDRMEPPPPFWLWTNVRIAAQELLELHLPPRSLFSSETVRLPPQCRLLMKNCFIDGVNWYNLQQTSDSRTLFSIHITEMEYVNIGLMNEGRRDQRTFYEFAEGEGRSMISEYLRLGRKYALPLTEEERYMLYSSLLYCDLKLDDYDVGFRDDFCWRLMDSIVCMYVSIATVYSVCQYDVNPEYLWLTQIIDPEDLLGRFAGVCMTISVFDYN